MVSLHQFEAAKRNPELEQTSDCTNKMRYAVIYICWDWKGVIHCEFLECNEKVNTELYVQHMQRLNKTMQQKKYQSQMWSFAV